MLPHVRLERLADVLGHTTQTTLPVLKSIEEAGQPRSTKAPSGQHILSHMAAGNILVFAAAPVKGGNVFCFSKHQDSVFPGSPWFSLAEKQKNPSTMN